jgi:hypothetical protein
MTKLELIQKLEVAKEISPVVSIEAMIALLNQIAEPETKTVISQVVIDKILSEIESCLDLNACDLVDTDNIELSLSYNNQIEVESVSIEVSNIMEHINSILDNYVAEES